MLEAMIVRMEDNMMGETKEIRDSTGNVLNKKKENKTIIFLKENVWNIIGGGLPAAISLISGLNLIVSKSFANSCAEYYGINREYFSENGIFEVGNIDLLIGGSPCTYWSVARTNKGRETSCSGMGWDLFNQYLRALKESKCKYFLYENNFSMSKNIITEKSFIISSFALCGFANLGSVAILVGGISELAPCQRENLSKLAFKALISGTFASYISAAIAGILI